MGAPQHAERSQEKKDCCPKLSFKIKKTTGDNFGQLINNEETPLQHADCSQEKKDCCPQLS